MVEFYGFGKQPFGDPNLDYGSQAPFHMSFYHEARIIYFFGNFLKKAYPEYRIHLFKSLSKFAFANNNFYWGYRFMGWAMHYLGDLSMPYHAVALPGVSASRMLWINLKTVLCFNKSKNQAIQLVSNRHAVFEMFQLSSMHMAYKNNDISHPMLIALKKPIEKVDYTKCFIKDVVTKESAQKAKKVDRMLTSCMPHKLVGDPKFETPGSQEINNLMELILFEKGQKCIDKMNHMIAEILQSYSMHLQSFYFYIMNSISD